MAGPIPQRSSRQSELLNEFARVYIHGRYSTPDLLAALEAMLGHGIKEFSKGPHQKAALEKNLKIAIQGIQEHSRGQCGCKEVTNG